MKRFKKVLYFYFMVWAMTLHQAFADPGRIVEARGKTAVQIYNPKTGQDFKFLSLSALSPGVSFWVDLGHPIDQPGFPVSAEQLARFYEVYEARFSKTPDGGKAIFWTSGLQSGPAGGIEGIPLPNAFENPSQITHTFQTSVVGVLGESELGQPISPYAQSLVIESADARGSSTLAAILHVLGSGLFRSGEVRVWYGDSKTAGEVSDIIIHSYHFQKRTNLPMYVELGFGSERYPTEAIAMMLSHVAPETPIHLPNGLEISARDFRYSDRAKQAFLHQEPRLLVIKYLAEFKERAQKEGVRVRETVERLQGALESVENQKPLWVFSVWSEAYRQWESEYQSVLNVYQRLNTTLEELYRLEFVADNAIHTLEPLARDVPRQRLETARPGSSASPPNHGRGHQGEEPLLSQHEDFSRPPVRFLTSEEARVPVDAPHYSVDRTVARKVELVLLRPDSHDLLVHAFIDLSMDPHALWRPESIEALVEELLRYREQASRGQVEPRLGQRAAEIVDRVPIK